MSFSLVFGFPQLTCDAFRCWLVLLTPCHFGGIRPDYFPTGTVGYYQYMFDPLRVGLVSTLGKFVDLYDVLELGVLLNYAHKLF